MAPLLASSIIRKTKYQAGLADAWLVVERTRTPLDNRSAHSSSLHTPNFGKLFVDDEHWTRWHNTSPSSSTESSNSDRSYEKEESFSFYDGLHLNCKHARDVVDSGSWGCCRRPCCPSVIPSAASRFPANVESPSLTMVYKPAHPPPNLQFSPPVSSWNTASLSLKLIRFSDHHNLLDGCYQCVFVTVSRYNLGRDRRRGPELEIDGNGDSFSPQESKACSCFSTRSESRS